MQLRSASQDLRHFANTSKTEMQLEIDAHKSMHGRRASFNFLNTPPNHDSIVPAYHWYNAE